MKGRSLANWLLISHPFKYKYKTTGKKNRLLPGFTFNSLCMKKWSGLWQIKNFLLVKGVFQHFHDSSTVWWTDWQAHPGSYSSAWSSHFFRFLSFLLIVCPEESGLPFCCDTAGEGKGGDQWYKNSDTSTYSLKCGLDALHLLKGLLLWWAPGDQNMFTFMRTPCIDFIPSFACSLIVPS